MSRQATAIPDGFHAQSDPGVCGLPILLMSGELSACAEPVAFRVRVGRWARGYCSSHVRAWMGDYLRLIGPGAPLRVEAAG
jgi:hypothetical protein